MNLLHASWYALDFTYLHLILVTLWAINKVFPESIQPYNMKSRDIYLRRYKMEETLYIGQWCLSPLQSLKVDVLGPHTVLPASIPLFKNTLQSPLLESPSAALLYFPESYRWSEISCLSKVILVSGKARTHRVPHLGCRGTESPEWFNVPPKNSAWDVMREKAHCHDEAANHWLPIAAAVFITLHLSASEEHWGSTLLIVWSGGLYSWWEAPSQSKNTVNMVLSLLTLPSSCMENQETSIGMLGLHFHIIVVDPWFLSSYDLLKEIWFIGNILNQVISNGSTMFLLLW